jgi:hypothetical protein
VYVLQRAICKEVETGHSPLIFVEYKSFHAVLKKHKFPSSMIQIKRIRCNARIYMVQTKQASKQASTEGGARTGAETGDRHHSLWLEVRPKLLSRDVVLQVDDAVVGHSDQPVAGILLLVHVAISLLQGWTERSMPIHICNYISSLIKSLFSLLYLYRTGIINYLLLFVRHMFLDDE